MLFSEAWRGQSRFALIFLCSIIILLHILFWEEDDGE